MSLALLQAKKNIGNTNENPSVGCVITKDNKIISVGSTSLNGRPHAEKNAIDSAKRNLTNSNLYVTLEPCSHYGQTSPCVNAIIKKKMNKVFFSIHDPDYRSFNKCSKIFKRKGIKVSAGILNYKTELFYKSYIKFKREILPFVTCKLAVSKDLYTINKNNDGWITNEFSRGRVHLMRSSHDCLITSSKTVVNDNPKLTCRINGLYSRSPSRVILDTKLRIPLKSQILRESNKFKTIIFYNSTNKKKISLLKKLKVKLYKMPLNKNGYLDLKKSLYKIKNLGFSRIFLESGIELIGSFLEDNLIDDFKLFISPKKLGSYGESNAKKYINKFLKKASKDEERVNLFGDKLINFKLK